MRVLLSGSFALACSAVLLAQAGAPSLLGPARPRHLTVATSASAPSVEPGATVSLFVDVVPQPHVHVYAPGAEDYLPITLTLTAPSGITLPPLGYPKSERLLFEPLNERIPVYQKPFRLTQPLVVGRSVAAGPLTLAGSLDYQACDDTVCFAPAKVPVSWTVEVRKPAATGTAGAGK